MPRPNQRIKVTDAQLKIILENARLPESHRQTITHLAHTLGLSRLTIRRQLMANLDPLDPEDIPIPEPKIRLWQRPCLRCKDSKPREVGLYLCASCRRSSTGIPDHLIFD